MTSRNRSRHERDTPDDPSDLCGCPDPSGCPDFPGGPACPGRLHATVEDHPADVLVRIQDLAGRPRGTGFVADHHGTVITSHEAVDGLPRLVLHAPGDRHCVVTADAVTPLPALDLALVRSEGLGVAPLPVTARESVETGTYVRIAAGCWREARVLGTSAVTYTATDRFHPLGDALELAIGTAGRDALRLGGGAAGGPVLDATTGAVLGVLGTALRSPGRDSGFAVPLPPRAPGAARTGGTTGVEDPLAELLAENAATVPAYGADLNIAGVLELTATSVRQDGPVPGPAAGPGVRAAVEPVERAAVTAEFAAFERGDAAVLGLVGPPGSGRTTQLAALAARSHRAGRPALWLRGADLRGDDGSVADAARRALDRAARVVAASRRPFPAVPDDLGDTGPERLARLARTAGRPLLLLLDGPEEMPSDLAHRLAEWTDGTARWLRATGARLVVACRAEYWEEAGARFPADRLHAADPCPDGLPPCVGLGDLTPEEARQARARYGIPEGVLADARHPLTLRMLAEVRAALADAADVPDVPVDRDTVFSAHLDLMCLRIAVRLAAGDGLRGTAVRRLAAKVSGQVHEAARRSLGAGRGELDREAFEAVFPPGPAPDRLGGGTGWAAAVLAEGLLVPAGTGYRFADEEFADWIHGIHLDLDEALRALVHPRRTPPDPGCDPAPVPHHRIGPVVQALLLLARQHGTGHLAARLADLVHALDAGPGSWWAARLLTESLARVPDATPYTGVLRMLADRIVAWREQRRTVPRELGPAFWTGLPLPLEARCALLRRLVHADGPPCESGPRFLAAAGRLLAADPAAVPSYLVRWFEDERPLPATPHATVATAAQALLHTHRRAAPDALTEALADSAHRRADQLLTVLAEEEPSAVCRAVDRWARDERPARRAAALTYGLRVAPYARGAEDRTLLRHAALALLARTADRGLHGGALALLVRDPGSRDRHLARALEHFAAGDPHLPPSALTGALGSHPEPVLDAFRARLGRAADAGEAFRALADATTPGLARPVAALVREAVERRPELAGHVAAYADRRLDRDTAPAARAVLRPLLTGLLGGGPEALRAALAGVLAAPGTPASRPLRRELLDALLARESDPGVLDAVLRAAARNTGPELRVLVHRTGLLLVRTPEGAARFDRALADLARHLPGFAAAVAGWLADAPREWAAVVGPSTRRTIENLAGAGVPA
ncbi:trypsin-like peptidase domain-containing protein [Streptomyces sp.]|uniref:trypsin-like peptidase domain-containing protein n=1 Tax=Streptomyces sp. TaxID=1931 RepID=UPI0028123EF0|nr:trypsin-like peptidase domain-containing protein [Streptomyces sp.]